MPAFERNCAPPLHHLITLSANSPLIRDRYVALNLQWDGRVPELRQADFEEAFGRANPVELRNLRDLLSYYKRNHVGRPVGGTFDRDMNGRNEIGPGPHESWCRPPNRVGTIINFSWHSEDFRDARRKYPLFRDFPGDSTKEEAWFETAFLHRTPSEQNLFLDQALSAIHDSRVKYGLKPVWVGEWSRLERLLERSAEEWLRSVGCQSGAEAKALVIALSYGPSDGMPPLFRPTQLESGPNELHFPLPGATETALGGFALNLSASPDAPYSCTREWVHCPFLCDSSQFIASGRRSGWAGAVPVKPEKIGNTRVRHRGYLGGCGLGIDSVWMDPVV